MSELNGLPDEYVVGTIRFDPQSYAIYQQGLLKLLAKVEEMEASYREHKERLELADSPYSETIDDLRRMISWGEKELAIANWRITARPSIASLRLLKAGALAEMQYYQLEKEKQLKSEGAVAKQVISQIDTKIAQIKDLAESGVLEGLMPSSVYCEIFPTEMAENRDIPEAELQDRQQAVVKQLSKSRSVVGDNRHQAVVLTALRVEYESVRFHLMDLREAIHPLGTVYEHGTFLANGVSWDVGIVEIGSGNARAALEAERIIQHFNPRVVFFVGVAGGIKDVKIGDVVAATKVYGYESGKAEEVFLGRPEVGKPSYAMEQRARAEARKADWLGRLGVGKLAPQPRVFVAPIAAGEKVLASTKSELFDLLKESYGDALAVEMEGHGFLDATRANQQVHALIVRGISDLIDHKRAADDAGSQELASRHASAFAFEVLAKFDVPEPEGV